MAPSSSSAKKAAKLAQKGKGQKVRFQGGSLFPVIVSLVIVLGIALVVYARESRPAADASAPTINDHWHHAYGFFLCDTWVELDGDGEGLDINGRPTNTDYVRTGVHSHSDGLIHWHAFTSAAVGRNAELGVFLDVYGVELSNDRLEFPEDQRAQLPLGFTEDGVFDEEDTQCEITDADGNTEMVDAELRVVLWDNISDTDDGTTFIAGFDALLLDQDGMAVTIAFAPNDADITVPPSVGDFATNVSNDSGQLPPDQLFEGVEVDEDGDITIDSIPAEDAETGDEVPDTDTDTETDTDTGTETDDSDDADTDDTGDTDTDSDDAGESDDG